MDYLAAFGLLTAANHQWAPVAQGKQVTLELPAPLAKATGRDRVSPGSSRSRRRQEADHVCPPTLQSTTQVDNNDNKGIMME
jgi:hypothetical protein